MDQQIFSNIFALVISLITVIITQLLIFRKLKKELALQNQAKFLEDAFKDNYAILFSLTMIKLGEDVKTQIQKIQNIIDSHNYTLSTIFVLNWVKYKDTITGVKSEEKKTALDILQKSMLNTWELFAVKYLEDILGLGTKEIKQLEKALRDVR